MKTDINYLDMTKVGLQPFTVNHRNLKPCPFCGDKEPDTKFRYESPENGGIDHIATVYCHKCPGKVEVKHLRKITHKDEPYEANMIREAVKRWNRRVS